MKRILVTYGGISAALTVAFAIVSLILMNRRVVNFDTGAVVGYAGMTIALSMVFFGIKAFRDNHQNGKVTFWKGVQVGMLITLISSLAYATTWEIYYRNAPGVMAEHLNKYTEASLNEMREGGASQDEIDKAAKRMAEMMEMYKNPFIRYGMTLAEILPVGMIIVLIGAGILRKKEVVPA